MASLTRSLELVHFWSLNYGLSLTWLNLIIENGYSKVMIEFDSLIATKLIQLRCVSNHPHFKIVVGIKSMLDHIENIAISHVM